MSILITAFDYEALNRIITPMNATIEIKPLKLVLVVVVKILHKIISTSIYFIIFHIIIFVIYN